MDMVVFLVFIYLFFFFKKKRKKRRRRRRERNREKIDQKKKAKWPIFGHPLAQYIGLCWPCLMTQALFSAHC